MSLLSSNMPIECLLSQLRRPSLPQEGGRRNPAGMVLSTTLPFQTQLLQQMLSALDQTSMSINEAEAPPSLLSTTWARGLDLKTPEPDHTRAIRKGNRQEMRSTLGLNLPQEGDRPHDPHTVRQGSRGGSRGLVPAKPVPVLMPEPTPAPEPLPAKTEPPATNAADGFLGKLAGVAKATAEALGLSPHLLLAQAALETGWGRKAIKDGTGQESFNLFGIKAGKHWTGKTVEVMTTEYIHGQAQKKVESFRAYGSYAESFSDYARLIKGRYGEAIANGATAEGFGQALQAKGYATDPNYAQKMTRVAQSVAYRLASAQAKNRDIG